MPFAVELFFDSDLDSRVRQVCKMVADEVGFPDTMAQKGSRPHLALAVFEDTRVDKAQAAVKALANDLRAFDIRLDSVGTFPGTEGVIFFAPEGSQALTDAHLKCQKRFLDIVQGMWSYYLVGNIVFHCSINLGLDSAAISKAMTTAQDAVPLAGKVVAIGLVKFPEVTFLGDFALSEGSK
ncbi:MAG TPA: 2'-5' RNA ligase family protein [bacterium]|jgi:hypothetical protein|nr:2'-5' RNA ligase family protein [bacterium]